jgi:hypothetical protein
MPKQLKIKGEKFLIKKYIKTELITSSPLSLFRLSALREVIGANLESCKIK